MSAQDKGDARRCCPVQELHNVAPPPPEDWDGAFLRNFKRLRGLSLIDVESVREDEREELVYRLPPSLEERWSRLCWCARTAA